MTKISQLSDIGASLAGGDEFVIRDVSDATTPNKKVTSSGIIDYVIGTGSVTGFTKISAGAGPLSEVACTFSGSTGTITMGTASAGSPVERLRIDSSGRLGLGTSSPDYTLHVSGANAQIGLTDTNVTDATWRLLAQTGNSTKLFRIYDSSNAADRFVINAAGNVGIGTSSPGYALDVASSVAQVGAFTDAFIQYKSTAGNWHVGASSSNAYTFYSGTYGTGTERLRIDSSGRVGIGTSAPRSLLQVQGGDVVLDTVSGTSSATLDIVSNVTTNSGQDATPGIAFRAPYDASSFRATYAAIWSKKESSGQGQQEGSFVIGTNSGSTIGVTEKLRINSAGRLGIGTSSPTTLLDVNADTVRVRTARTPASASATGAVGEICWDASYIYVCTATNTWKRAALSTW